MAITENEKKGFEKTIDQLKKVSTPLTTSDRATMLSANIDGWIEQIIKRIEVDLRNLS